MQSDVVETLLDELAASLARGEQPHSLDYLARAGAGADELQRMMEAFLVAAPRPERDPRTSHSCERGRRTSRRSSRTGLRTA
jgi:hypothetical protein